MSKHIVVIDLVGAMPRHFDAPPLFPELAGVFRAGGVRPLAGVFPAVTCPVQASLTTGALPSRHGIIANGLFDRSSRAVTMWTWPAACIERPPIWKQLRQRMPRAKTAVMFFQGLKATDADIYINPHPKHTPDGKTIPWCDSNPDGLYERLVEKLGHFPLHKYWGPMAGIESSQWILQASLRALAEYKPNLSLVYVPHLDYVGQREGPDGDAFAEQARRIDAEVAQFVRDLRKAFAPSEPAVVLLSEYAFRPVSGAGFPNRALRDAGLLKVREEQGAELVDMESSRAFAMVDHQLAHVYCDADAVDDAAAALAKMDAVAEVCRGERLRDLGVNHANTGEIVLLAKPDRWFAYYWWHNPEKAPAFARTVDIHRKPGYDPVELFFDPATRSIPLTPERVKGSHGLPPTGPGDAVVFAHIGFDRPGKVPGAVPEVCPWLIEQLVGDGAS
jgi:predicted AlkP superfamily pyrophosphatase or phosphodiesterase